MVVSDHLSGVLMALICTALVGCKSDIEFSEAPFPSEDKSEASPVQTTIFAGFPVDLTEFQIGIDHAIPDRILGIQKTLRHAACYQKKERTICNSADAEGTVTKDGTTKLIANDGVLLALIPVKVDFSARGRGRAEDARDAVIERFTLRVPYKVSLSESWEANVSQAKISIDGDMKSIRLFGREIAFRSVLKRKVGRYLRNLPAKLETVIAVQSFQTTVRKSWRRLFDPIQISSTPDIWLRGRPRSVSFGGFADDGEQLKIRIAFTTYLGTYYDERPVPLMPMALPVLTTNQTEKKNSQINMKLVISFDEFKKRIDKAMAQDEINIGTDENEILIHASNPELYASRRFLALQLHVKVDKGDEWFDQEGMLYMTALLWFEADKGILKLKHVSITQPRSNPEFFRNGRFLFKNTPYTKWFRQAVQFDLNDRFAAVLTRADTMVNRKISKAIWLSGRFGDMVVSSINPRRDHLRLNLKLRGTLTLSATPPRERTQRSTKLSAAGGTHKTE